METRVVQIPDDWNGIMLVGEAPGADELNSKYYSKKHSLFICKPFIGKAGLFLRSCAKAAGFEFERCIVTTTIHKKLKYGSYGKAPAAVEEDGQKYLRSLIERFEPKLIVAIGDKAFKILTGKDGLMKFRGSIVPSSLVAGYNVFATIHPAFIFKGNHKYAVVLQMDLRKAAEELTKPPAPQKSITIINSQSEACKALYGLALREQPVAIDIETAGGALITYGVATSATEAIVIPKNLCSNVQVLRAISEFADSPVPKIFHNCLFDVFHNAYYYKIFNRNVYFDTMLAQHALFPTLPKSLAFCSSIYTREPYWKDEGKEVIKGYNIKKIKDWEAFYIYNGKDCCVTYEVYERQLKELDFWRSWDIFKLMMRATDYALLSMMQGFGVDDAAIKQFASENEKAVIALEKIKLRVLGDINFNSPLQVRKLLYEYFKLPKKKSKTGNLATDAKTIRYFETFSTSAQPYFGLIRKTRETVKLRGFYDIKRNEDNRVRFSQKIHGTYTGRWSTSKSITGSGLNLQNIPKKLRNFYVPRDGNIFIQWDLSNSEARIVAALCADERWLKSFDEEDQHSVVAASLFGIPKSRVRDHYDGDKTYRDYGKKIAHACIDKDTEVLTPNGWVKAFEYDDQPIYQVDPHNAGEGKFVYPDEFSTFDFDGNMFLIENPQINQLITPGHGMPYFNGYSLTKQTIDNLATLNSGRLHNYVHNVGASLIDDDWLRLAVAAHADGNFQKYNIRWKFRKQRKVERLIAILNSLNVPFIENVYGLDTIITIKKVDVINIVLEWSYSIQQILALSHEKLSVISKELTKWDGYEGKSMREFSTVKKDVAENVQLLHKLSGEGNSNIQTKEFSDGAFGKGSYYVVRFNKRKYINLGKHCTITREHYKDKVYNFAVNSGYYLVRRKGKISVTGNTHYLEQPTTLSLTLGCPLQEAKDHIISYHKFRPKLVEWHDKVRKVVGKTRIIRNIFGRTIQFFGPFFGQHLTEAVAAEPQSTSADYLVFNGLNVLDALPELEFKLQVHDSFLVEVKNDLSLLTDIMPRIKSIMEQEIIINDLPFKIPIDFELGLNWGNMKEVKTLSVLPEIVYNINNGA